MAILAVVKGDCGLDHHQQAIEAVRAQDWEESIRVGIFRGTIYCSREKVQSWGLRQAVGRGLARGVGRRDER